MFSQRFDNQNRIQLNEEAHVILCDQFPDYSATYYLLGSRSETDGKQAESWKPLGPLSFGCFPAHYITRSDLP